VCAKLARGPLGDELICHGQRALRQTDMALKA
jgi:hypothetical protein